MFNIKKNGGFEKQHSFWKLILDHYKDPLLIKYFNDMEILIHDVKFKPIIDSCLFTIVS